MTQSRITELENNLSLLRQIVDQDEANLTASADPLVDRIFLASSNKFLKNIQKQLYEAKAEKAHELIRLRLVGNQMTGSIKLKTLAKLLNPLSQMLEHCSWRVWDKDGDATKIEDSFSELLDLRLEGISTGSTVLSIVGNTSPDLTGTSALESGLKNIFSLLNSKNDEIPQHINEVGVTAAKATSKLMEELERNSIAVELQWNSPSGEMYWDGRPAEIVRVKSILEAIGSPNIEIITIRGTVQVLSIRNRIEILTSEQDPPLKIVATYHHSMWDEIQDLHLGESRDFIIEKTSYPDSMSRNVRNAYRLKNIKIVNPGNSTSAL